MLRRSYTTTATGIQRELKAKVRFLGATPQLLDMYVSFSRQAAQAMDIVVSKTTLPIQHTSAQLFPPREKDDVFAHQHQDAQDSTTAPSSTTTMPADTSKLSFDYKRWTVNRSSFVHGRHQDQFEIRTYKRDFKLFDADTETVKRWLHYVSVNLPFGVGVEYSIISYEPLPDDLLAAKSAKAATLQ